MPFISQTSISSSPFGAVTSRPLIVSLTVSIFNVSIGCLYLNQCLLYAALEVASEFLYCRLYRHHRRVTQRTEALEEDLVGEIVEQLDVTRHAFVAMHSLKYLHQPACSFSAGCAPAAGLVLVKVRQTARSLKDIGSLVHDDDTAGPEHRAGGGNRFVVHVCLLTLFGGENRNTRAAGNYGL